MMRTMCGMSVDFDSVHYNDQGKSGYFYGVGLDVLDALNNDDAYKKIAGLSTSGLTVDYDFMTGLNVRAGFAGRIPLSGECECYSNLGIRVASDFEWIIGSLWYVNSKKTGIVLTKDPLTGCVMSANLGPCYDVGFRFTVLKKVRLCAGLSGFYAPLRLERMYLNPVERSNITDTSILWMTSLQFTPYIGLVLKQ